MLEPNDVLPKTNKNAKMMTMLLHSAKRKLCTPNLVGIHTAVYEIVIDRQTERLEILTDSPTVRI